MPTPFDNLTIVSVSKLAPSVPTLAIQARQMIAGDMWASGSLWIGEMPPTLEAQVKLQAGLVSENVLKELVVRHVGGVLGREPRWGLVERQERGARQPRLAPRAAPQVSPAEQAVADTPALPNMQRITDAEDALTGWWDARNMIQLLQRVGARVIAEGRAPLRVLIPSGRRAANGLIPHQSTLAAALEYIYIDDVAPAVCGVHTDPASRLDVGVYLYSEDGQNRAEVSYVNDQGLTVLQTIGNESDAFQLNRRLFHYDLTRDPLITEQMTQGQKALTLTLTQMMRNVNLAGSRERVFLNAKAPGTWVAATLGEEGAVETVPGSAVYQRFIAGTYKTGPSVTNFVMGEELYDTAGRLIGVANPNVSVTDPVPTTTFEHTRNVFRAGLYAQAQQAHALMADDATASGRSRVEARAEYKSSLDVTKTALDDAGRWLLETVLALAAVLMGAPGAFADLRVEFGAIVDTGPLSPEEQQEIRANVEAGLTSRETAMSELGVADVDAEQQRIDKEKEQLGPSERVNLQRSQLALQRDQGVDVDLLARIEGAAV